MLQYTHADGSVHRVDRMLPHLFACLECEQSVRTDDDRKAHMEEEEDDEKMEEDKVPRECCTYLEYYECVCVLHMESERERERI